MIANKKGRQNSLKDNARSSASRRRNGQKRAKARVDVVGKKGSQFAANGKTLTLERVALSMGTHGRRRRKGNDAAGSISRETRLRAAIAEVGLQRTGEIMEDLATG